MRLDIFIYKNRSLKSRQHAQSLIKSGNVKINGEIITKSGYNVDGNENIEISYFLRYVSRGGLKLEKALSCFDISVDGKIALDIGASTGGFTDCLLQNGASKVFAVDVGNGQLAEKLKNDSRVVNLENTHIKDLTTDNIRIVDIITVDVSFISLKKVLPLLKKFMDTKTSLICLFKPQFEIGKRVKNGVVKNDDIHKSLLGDFSEFAGAEGFFIKKIELSPILGGDGNKEFLLFLSKMED